MVKDGCVDGCGQSAPLACVEDIRLHSSTVLVFRCLFWKYGQEKHMIQSVKRCYILLAFGDRGLSVCQA